MQLSQALLCSLALATMITAQHGTVEAAAGVVQDTAAKSPDRKVRADTTAPNLRIRDRRLPGRKPPYSCPACGMG